LSAYAARPRAKSMAQGAILSRRDPFELAALARQTPRLIEGRTRSTFRALHVLLPFNPLNAELFPSLAVPKHLFQRGSLHGHVCTARRRPQTDSADKRQGGGFPSSLGCSDEKP